MNSGFFVLAKLNFTIHKFPSQKKASEETFNLKHLP